MTALQDRGRFKVVITKEQFERYQKYDGDVEKWVASQKRSRDEVLTGADWSVIEKAIQRLQTQKKGFASHDYRDETERILLRTFGDAALIDAVRTMAP